MAEIIRPSFGGKPPAQLPRVEEASSQPASQEEKDRVAVELLKQDVTYLTTTAEQKERVRQACKSGEEITDYIFSMARFEKKDESVNLRRAAIQTLPLETLCGYLLDSSEHQWNTQPHYFGAVIVEMNDRLKFIKELCPDDDIPQFK